MTEGLKVGLELTKMYEVEKADTAQVVKSGGLAVLATPVLLAWMEQSAFLLPELYLTDQQTTVGVQADIRHIAPTPVGMKVKVHVGWTEVTETKLIYKTEAFDDVKKVAEGLHTRVIVDKKAFMTKVIKKKDAAK